MFAMNKDTLILFSLAVALFAIVYLYRDLQKAKVDFQKLNEESLLAAAPPPPPQVVYKSSPPPAVQKKAVAVVDADETE